MAKMVEIVCKCGCGRKKQVSTADVKRGWGQFYSKSCKAKYQTKQNGRGRPNWLTRDEECYCEEHYNAHSFDGCDGLGQDGRESFW